MSELHKLKAQQKVKDEFNARNGLNTIQIQPLVFNFGFKVQIFREKKRWSRLFKVLSITDTDITINMRNGFVTF